MIDSHCHLADEAFSADLGEVIDRARAAGLERVLVILEGANQQEERQAGEAHTRWSELRVAVGVHPHQAHQFAGDAAGAVRAVREQIERTPFARAVGEIGLDYHYDYSPRDVQLAVFRAQVDLACELQLPIVVHAREADEDTIAVLEAAPPGALRGVLHCFTGTADLARAALDLGFYISFAGILTFPKAGALRDVARSVPMDRLLVETDSPFLSPVPLRGGRNELARVVHTAATLAELHGTSVDELGRVTTANFHALFRP
jgi:TatD DNase family protein